MGASSIDVIGGGLLRGAILGMASAAGVSGGSALVNCARTPGCLGSLATATVDAVGAEYAGQITLIPAVSAVGGKYILQAGDTVVGIFDDATSSVYRATGDIIDGRVIVNHPSGGVGYIDEATGAFREVDRITNLATNSVPVKPLVDPSTNVASAQRTQHILHGDATGGGHLWPGGAGKTPFPQNWDANRIMSTTSDLATNPNLLWKPQTGNGGLYTKSGKPARFVVTDANGNLPVVDGVPVRVIIEPAGDGIITAYPKY